MGIDACCPYGVSFQRGYCVAAVTSRATPSLEGMSSEAHKAERGPVTGMSGHSVVHAAQKAPAQSTGHENASKVSEPLAAPVSFYTWRSSL